MDSLMHPAIGGLIYVTGLPGRGKTTLAASLERPDKSYFIDLDLKFANRAEMVGMPYTAPDFLDPDNPYAYEPSKMADWFRKAIKDIPKGTTHVIIDNVSIVEAGLGYIVGQTPAKYGVNAENAKAGRYGGVNPGISTLWGVIVQNMLSRGVITISTVAHMSQPWVDGKPVPNRFSGKGNKALMQYANLALVMVTGDHPPVPSAIVLKEQLGLFKFENGEYVISRGLPPRLPQASWGPINAYLKTPPNFKALGADEIPTKREINAYGDFLSEEQLEFIKTVREYSEGEDTNAGTSPVNGLEIDDFTVKTDFDDILALTDTVPNKRAAIVARFNSLTPEERKKPETNKAMQAALAELLK